MITPDQIILGLERLKKVNLTGIEVSDQRDTGGVVAGYLLAMHAALPATPVTHVTNYYVTQHETAMLAAIDKINDSVFINPQIAIEVARNVYQFRYNMVHDTESVMGHAAMLIGTGVMGVPPKVLKLIERLGPETMKNAALFSA